ncbi:unnamed protein product [Diamesa hyperborea]
MGDYWPKQEKNAGATEVPVQVPGTAVEPTKITDYANDNKTYKGKVTNDLTEVDDSIKATVGTVVTNSYNTNNVYEKDVSGTKTKIKRELDFTKKN